MAQQYIVAVINTAERKCVGMDFPETEDDLLRLARKYRAEFGEGHVVLSHPSEERLALNASRESAAINYEARMQCLMISLTHPMGVVRSASKEGL